MVANKQISSTVKLPFSFAVGTTASKFYKALRDEKTIYATRCIECNKVSVPARSSCPVCHQLTTEWVALPNTGTLQGWTEIEGKEQTWLAMIQLEGADNLFLHKLGKCTPDILVKGLAVRVEWQQQRVGSLDDISYFCPLEGAEL